MTDHVQEEDHAPTVGGPVHRPQRVSAPAGSDEYGIGWQINIGTAGA